MAEYAGARLSPQTRVLAGFVMALSNFMVVLDTSIANVSVPHIAGSLAISPDQGTWVITSYSVAEAICVPLTGWLTQRFGTVRCYVVSMIGFAVFSALCGSSVSLGMLVAARIGQGLCGGPIMPITQTLLLRVFPPQQRGTAMGLWAMTAVTAPIAGPLLGGTISDNLSWHWIFFINLPVAVIAVLGVLATLRPVETETEKTRVDVIGLALLILWVGALQIMLDIGRTHDWFGSSEVVILAVIAAIGFAAFVIWELTEKQPIVDLRVFRHRGFTSATFAMAVFYATMFSSTVVTPQWLQTFMGYTAQSAGFVLAWQGVFAVVMAPIVGRLTGKVDARWLVTAGTLWLGVTALLRSHWTSGADYWSLAIPHLLTGFGMPLSFVPITILSLSSVEPRETASAAGLTSFVRTLSGAIGASAATTVWVNREQINRADLTNIINPSPAVLDQMASHGMTMEQGRGMLEQLVELQAVTLATTQLFQLAAVLFVIAAAVIWIVPKPKRAASAEGAH